MGYLPEQLQVKLSTPLVPLLPVIYELHKKLGPKRTRNSGVKYICIFITKKMGEPSRQPSLMTAKDQ